MRYRVEPLQRARLQKGLGKSQLAQLIGVTPAVITMVERGENQSPKTISKLAHVLGVAMDELVVTDGRKKRKSA